MKQHENIAKFERLCERPEDLRTTAGAVLAAVGADRGVDELLKRHRWYAQICECVLEGDTRSVTEEEMIAFVDLHVSMVAWLKSVL